MTLKATLERALSDVGNFTDPDPTLEQYRTPASVGAHLLALADLQDDIEGRTVLDLGSGTGMLTLGAAMLGPKRAVGIEIDDAAIGRARENERVIKPSSGVTWVNGDVRRVPVCASGCTVIANPPFGAHRDNRHADRAFLETLAPIADVSYTIHNEGSKEFVEAFSMDHGGSITHAYRVAFPLPNQFLHHEADRESIEAELYRIEWAAEG